MLGDPDAGHRPRHTPGPRAITERLIDAIGGSVSHARRGKVSRLVLYLERKRAGGLGFAPEAGQLEVRVRNVSSRWLFADSASGRPCSVSETSKSV
jgi:hypothetical protein